MEQKQTYMRLGSRPSPEGTRLLFAGDKVGPMMMMCPGGQQKNDKKSQTEDKPR